MAQINSAILRRLRQLGTPLTSAAPRITGPAAVGLGRTVQVNVRGAPIGPVFGVPVPKGRVVPPRIPGVTGQGKVLPPARPVVQPRKPSLRAGLVRQGTQITSSVPQIPGFPGKSVRVNIKGAPIGPAVQAPEAAKKQAAIEKAQRQKDLQAKMATNRAANAARLAARLTSPFPQIPGFPGMVEPVTGQEAQDILFAIGRPVVVSGNPGVSANSAGDPMADFFN